MADKVAGLRIFEDENEKMNFSVVEAGGQILSISQFTLYGDTRKGRRPSWVQAAAPDEAEPIIDRFCDELRSLGATVATGRFRADMAVALVNDGPVTLLVEVSSLVR